MLFLRLEKYRHHGDTQQASSGKALGHDGMTALGIARLAKTGGGGDIADEARLAGGRACARALEAHPSCGGGGPDAAAAAAEEEDGGGEID